MIIRVIRTMQMVVITNEELKEELLSEVDFIPDEIIWIDEISKGHQYKDADVFIDLLFSKEHLAFLQSLSPRLIIINSVEETLPETDASFVRINGWPTFLKSTVTEASSLHASNKQKAEAVFSLFNKKIKWMPDEAGFVTPRVISMIINEAFIALNEGVSTKDEIDTAMKLGTNYPYGPFEWAEKIGIKRIASLLRRLGQQHSRYASVLPLK